VSDVPEFADGGIISGPKGPGDDSVPIVLKAGCEYILRADATDDDLQDESFVHEGPCEGVEHPPGFEPPADEPGTVEPELRVKARQVPVVIEGVLHGYRDEE
jgi:hypothetical protein